MRGLAAILFVVTWLTPAIAAEREAYSVDSGCSTCSVLSGGNLAATRNFFDGSGPFACAIPEGLL